MQDSNSGILDNFAQRLRALRNSCNLGQAELGKLVGKSPATVSDWEKGKSQPGLEEIAVLAQRLGVPPARLAFGEIPLGVDTLKLVASDQETEARAEFEAIINAAAGMPSRIGWITEQLRLHLKVPKHWRRSSDDDDAGIGAYRAERSEKLRQVAAEAKASNPKTEERSDKSA